MASATMAGIHIAGEDLTMPVTLQMIDHARWQSDEQVRIDLSRIYHEAPLERLPAAPDDFIQSNLSAGHRFCSAFFNDRHIGALLCEDDGESWSISRCCVRQATRRRGVGTRLMALMSLEAAAAGRLLVVPCQGLTVADELLISRLGYIRDPARDGFVLAQDGMVNR
ncbi:acetyl-CoA sensor PanZ family protein [Cobetia sp. L2A1]|uniref:acetyl-CoA sensor PanZ family protein n=1 Tax=Cobetia sp. L2A1 TaxID=2686360 RepID=UPI001E403DF9|nr:acetyl-CoA sensor PanZ family protein [Cobetia sp. L2A1]